MKILLLCEGDAESPVGSFSGISKSVVDHLRLAGDEVATADCDLSGPDRLLAAAPVYSPRRSTWAARYHLGGWPFRLRSAKARRNLRDYGATPDVILQLGATFAAPGGGEIPYFLYCDSNIRVSQKGVQSGHSWAASLTTAEIDAIAAREQTVYNSATRVFTLSDNLRNSFLENFRMPPAQVVTAHAGPNLTIPEIQLPRRRDHSAPPTVLFVGAQFERKGGDVLLSAFADVRQRVPNARLLIIGPKSVPDADGVECLGFLRKDVPADAARLRDAYDAADVFCLPTRFEPFGIVFVEAMFYALPCVGTRAWAVPEMVLDGKTGFTVEVDDRAALAERLVTLLTNPEMAARMGEAGREHAARHFTWPAVTGLMRTHMQEELERRGRRGQ